MMDDPQTDGVAVLRTRDGFRLAVRVEEVESVLELDSGCQIVTGSDVYVVDHSWPEVAGLVWPELFRE